MAYQRKSDGDTEGEAEFNMGLSYLDRINVLLYYYNEAARVEDPVNMMKVIDRLYSEVYPMVLDKEKEKHVEARKKVREAYEKFLDYNKNFQISRQEVEVPYKPPKNFFEDIMEWELMLRKELKRTGMLMPLKSKTLAAAKTDFNY